MKNKYTDDKYGDIIGLPHHVSKRHPQMSMRNRAAQFAPFAALVGHGEAIDNTADTHIEEWNEGSGIGLERGEFEDI